MNTSNYVNLIGYIGLPPVRKTLPSGTELLELRLATNSGYKDRNGNRVDRTDWHNIKCFGRSVDVLDRYVSKGDQLSIVGTLRYEQWTDKHDQKRISPEIILHSFSFLNSKRSASRGQAAQSAAVTAANPDRGLPEPAFVGTLEEPDAADDLPF